MDIIGGDWGGGLGGCHDGNGNWRMFDFGNFFISRYRLESRKGSIFFLSCGNWNWNK